MCIVVVVVVVDQRTIGGAYAGTVFAVTDGGVVRITTRTNAKADLIWTGLNDLNMT